jgi:hypothetical protein
MRSNRKYIVACCVLITSAMFATPLLAFPHYCLFTGLTSFAPPYPRAKDAVTFDINLGELPIPGGVPAVALSKTTVAAGSIRFDVILTSPANFAIFPEYQSYPTQGSENDITGSLDPLAVGGYFVTTAIRTWDPVNGFVNPCAFLGDRTTTLTVYADADGLSPVIEYYNSNLDHYFMTQSPTEIAALDAGVFSGWVRTGQSFLAYLPAEGGGQPILRFYGLPSAGLDTHFFTFASSPDLAVVEGNPSWELESVDAFNLDPPDSLLSGACPRGDIPVYRLWNGRTDSNHRYTTDPAIKAQMIAKGYIAEGYGPDAVMMCAFTR